jgi:hypothetical protein
MATIQTESLSQALPELEAEFGELEGELGEFGEFEGELGEFGELEGEVGEFEEESQELEGEVGEFEEESQELEEEVGELEGAAPAWRGAYPAGEGEAETEAFFESLAEYAVGGGGGRGGGGGLGRVGAAAARAAASGGSGVPLATLSHVARTDGGYVEGEAEVLGESALEFEMLMEHFGHAATEAETEADAEAFIFPLLPLAAKFLAPKLLKFGARKILPRLLRGTMNVVRTLRRNPVTRPLVRATPTIVRRTMRDIAGQIERGRPLTGRVATRLLAKNTRQVLSNPRICVACYRRSRRLDRRYHATAPRCR